MEFNKVLVDDMEYISSRFNNSTKFEDKTIMITGCAGFLGFYMSHYFSFLISKGIKIKRLLLLDNFIINRPEWLYQLCDISNNIEVKEFDVAKDSISSIEGVEEVDYIIHMASIASPTFYRKYPIETIEANTLGLRNLFEYFKDKELSGLLYFSSSEIYGDADPNCIPTKESYTGNVSSIGPRACYDESKRFCETLCYVYNLRYNLPVRIVRPFNNYGPGMSIEDKRVPADFAKAVLNGDDIIILSDGTPTRTYCYIADAIVGYLKVLTYKEFDFFNIGITEPEISVFEFATLYQSIANKLWGYEGEIIYQKSADKDYLTHNPSRRCPDITKANCLLAYNPEIRVEEGIKRFLSYLRLGSDK